MQRLYLDLLHWLHLDGSSYHKIRK